MRPVLCMAVLAVLLSGCLPRPSGPVSATPEEMRKWIGQDKKALIDAFGKPEKISTPIFDDGTTEEWEYRYIVQHPESQTPYRTTEFVIVKKTGRIRHVRVH